MISWGCPEKQTPRGDDPGCCVDLAGWGRLASGAASAESLTPMAYPTAPAAARPASVFTPEGVPWTAVPHSVPRGLARDTLYAVLTACRTKPTTKAPDRVLARLGGMSERTIQRGLRLLEVLGWISRLRRHGGRLITVLRGLAGRKCAPKPAKCAPKAPVHRSATAAACTDPPKSSPPSSMRGKMEENAVPPVAASTPAGTENQDEPSPWTRRWFGGLPDVRAKLEAVPVLRG